MLALEPHPTPSGQKYFCLDMLKISWRQPDQHRTSSATLLEVWEGGGLLQTDMPLPTGIYVTLSPLSSPDVRSEVDSCIEDDYGYIVEFSVLSVEDWFPASYQPPYLAEKSSEGQPGQRKLGES